MYLLAALQVYLKSGFEYKNRGRAYTLRIALYTLGIFLRSGKVVPILRVYNHLFYYINIIFNASAHIVLYIFSIIFSAPPRSPAIEDGPRLLPAISIYSNDDAVTSTIIYRYYRTICGSSIVILSVARRLTYVH